MIIAFVGKFGKIHDEEYIARSFESLGHEVIRLEQTLDESLIHRSIVHNKPDILIFTKWNWGAAGADAIKRGREWGLKTVCWVFDLYWGYEREFRIPTSKFFGADYVFTTDGGHASSWSDVGVNHQCVRQGIYKDECILLHGNNPEGIVFVGSENPFNSHRNSILAKIKNDYTNFRWIGRNDTDTMRGMKLNELFSETKIVVGDSVYSKDYWSNRVVETLGRGGFLIHQEVEGLSEEYPHLVTYKKGDYSDLKAKIDYYLEHEDERLLIVQKNFEWVRDNYTMDKKCASLISKL